MTICSGINLILFKITHPAISYVLYPLHFTKNETKVAAQRIPIRLSYKMPDVGQTGLPEVRETQLWGNEK